MIRVLVMIAVAGFFVSLVTLSTAVGIGGPEVLAHGAWNWDRWGDWGGRWSHDDWDNWSWDDRHDHGRGAQTTRTLDWKGGDALDVDIPADVQYTQGPEGKVTITGAANMVQDVEIDDGHIRYAEGRHRHHLHWGDLQIVMTAPSVTRFSISGSGNLRIDGYKQDKMDIDISGDGDVTAKGETGAIGLDVSGSGDADLSALKAKSARVDINGSGEAKLAPSDQAKVDISGSGDVTLLSHPPHLESSISGSGTLRQEDRTPEAATPAPAPAPAPKKGKKA